MTHCINKIHVKRCCPIGNKLGCTLWTVRNHDGYSLGKFGTYTGALDFAMGRANHRALNSFRDSSDQEIEYVVEVED